MVAAAAMAAAVSLAAVLASAAAQAEVRWEVSYLTLEPLGDAQKARTCCHHLSVLVLLLSECSRFRPDKKAFDFFGYFPWFSLSFATPFVT